MRTINIGLVGAGMFGGDVHLRTYADLERSGIAPWLGRIGMDDFASEFADVEFNLVGIATRTKESAERATSEFSKLTGNLPLSYWGDTPWIDLLEDSGNNIDILAVATPDNLHLPPIMEALERDVHVITEKPMVLHTREADSIIQLAKSKRRLAGLDMHKRYDPDHLKIFYEIIEKLGKMLYGQAVLEEPLEVSSKTFKWARESDPFTYVAPHWLDLFIYYLGIKPVSLFAVGQKGKLVSMGIDTWDAVQVSVIFDNGMHIHFVNNWITPPDFEGPVLQRSEILGTEGKVVSHTQDRGLRYWYTGGGTRTSNTHFTRDVPRPDGSKAYVGYGKDSLIACILAIMRREFHNASDEDLEGTYPTAEEGRLHVVIVEAAAIVRDLNYAYLTTGQGTPVTARFNETGITILDPIGKNQVIYDQPI
ncbi:MAG: Gfo/Idh/MocA family oxidoreductase [Candidatus Doudnabacteria bacterium]